MKIILLPEVLDYFNKLTEILYDKGYFSFEENALQYVEDLLIKIETTLPYQQRKKAPLYFNEYGENIYYITIRKSKVTQWYIFFTIYEDKNEIVYLVRHITNNHVSAQYFI
ncbi:MAG: hypothetical protein LUH15_02880 [Tannerellaceae bacterium]|nr:hypothetical protein [Tannerellaceae bacterium]